MIRRYRKYFCSIHVIIKMSPFFAQIECTKCCVYFLMAESKWMYFLFLFPLRLLSIISPLQHILSSSSWVFSWHFFLAWTQHGWLSAPSGVRRYWWEFSIKPKSRTHRSGQAIYHTSSSCLWWSWLFVKVIILWFISYSVKD